MIVYPEWALSPEGVARGWQCSRFIIPNTPLTLGTQNPCQVETYKTHLGSEISEQQVYRADHAGMSYLFIIRNNLTSQLGWDFTLFPKLRHSHMLFSTIR